MSAMCGWCCDSRADGNTEAGDQSDGTSNPKVFFDMTADGARLGRIVMEQRAEKGAAHGQELPRPVHRRARLRLHGLLVPSRHSRLHVSGGDFTNHNGTGGHSIYGDRFADENFTLRHTGLGMLPMANAGPDTNGSQFFLCVARTEWLDGKHVVFGAVTDGMDVVTQIKGYGSSPPGKTFKQIIIQDCGQL